MAKKASKAASKKTKAAAADDAAAEEVAEIPFETALEQLHTIVAQLEEGALPLEASLAEYERGMALVRRCHTTLQQVEQRITQLAGFDEQGQPEMAPFDGTATTQTLDRAGRRTGGDLFTE